MIIEVGGNTLDCDVEATIAAFKGYTPGLWKCDCAGCRNLRAARDIVFTDPVLRFFAQFGIDASKPHECYEVPGPDWMGGYEGWYHFIGRAVCDDTVEISDHLRVFFVQKGALAPPSFRSQPYVQLEFELTNVPWLLNEPWTL